MISRRNFVTIILSSLGTLALAIKPRPAQARTLAVSLDSLPALKEVGGSVTAKLSDQQVILIRESEDVVRALDPTCTHKQCMVSFDKNQGRIVCGCHDSVFELDGAPLSGPATSPLRSFPARISEGRVLITVE